MKFKGSKKIVSLFLAVLMVVSSVPAFAINASAAVNTSTDVSALETAMHSYEDKMKTGGIMTNMKAAYDAYVNAQKAYDACVYGYNDAYVAKATTDLTNATNAMTEWTAPTFTAKAYHMNQEAKGAENNIVYCAVNPTWWSDWKQVDEYKAQIAMANNIVACYDGNPASIPVSGQYQVTNSNSRGVYWTTFTAPSSSDYQATMNQKWTFALRKSGDYWDEVTSSGNFSYISGEKTRMQICKSVFDKQEISSSYNKIDLISTNTSTYYNAIDYSTFTFGSRFDYKDKDTFDLTYNATGTGYLINYKPIKDRISTLSTELAKYNVANYKQGGLESLLSAIDACTAVNPNSYGYASNVANAVKDCGDAIKAAMGKTYSVTVDDTKYQSLREAIAGANTASTAKTADSLVEYGKAIKVGRDFFANLATYTNNGDNAESLANAIKNKYNALVNVDTDDAYSNFDAAVKVVEAMNQDALTADGKTAIANALSTQKAIVYKTLSGDDANAYYLATGQQPTGELKNTANNETDPCTASLLNTAQNTEYIKKSTLNFAAQIDGVNVSEANKVKTDIPYGELVELSANDFADVKALNGNYSVRWTVSYEENGGSRKITSIDNTVLVRVTENMTVTALVTNENSKENNDQYIVKFYNLYNNLDDVAYVSKDKLPAEGTVKNTTISVGTVENYKPDVPFYKLTGFTVSAPDKYNVVKIRPLYDTIPNVIINVIKGNVKENNYVTAGSNEYAIDRPLYLETSVADFYAWAVKTTDGKYQIVSYDKDYVFKTYVNETYTPVVQISDTSYEVYTGNGDETEPLTADNIDQFNNNTDYNLSNNDYLYAKLKSKAPFVYIEKAQDINVDGVDKYRLYIRITAGSDSSLSSFGLKNGDKTFVVKERNNLTGQFSVTFKNKPADTSAVKAYASYKFNYNYAGVDYNIVATDLSSIPTV